MRGVIPIIRHHHERWDGSGYPDGLVGNQIPFLAQVFQLIDIYDALTSERPYKPAFTSEAALAMLDEETCKGWRNPDLVAQFKDFIRVTEGNSPDAVPTVKDEAQSNQVPHRTSSAA